MHSTRTNLHFLRHLTVRDKELIMRIAVPGHDEQIRVMQSFGGLVVKGHDAVGKEAVSLS